MRPKKILPVLFMLICGMAFSQNYLKVDQNPNAPTGDHVYNDLQECIDAANDGDVIYIIPAVDSYGEVTLNKRLTLIGSGWQADNQSNMVSKVDRIFVDPLYADGSTIDGVLLMTTTAFPVVLGITNAPVDTLKNFEIRNCRVPGIVQQENTPIKNMVVRNNVCQGLNFNGSYGAATINFRHADGMTEDVVISNNIVVSNFATGWVKYCVNAANGTIIKNNLFYSSTGHPAFAHIRNSFVSNNVFFGASPYNGPNYSSYNNVFTNNLSYGCGSNCALPAPSTAEPANSGGGNLENTNPLFTSINVSWYWNVDFDLTMEEFSPLENGGSDGTHIGIFGGDYPFDNYQHLRSTPWVHSMSVPGIIMENQNIQLDAILRTNQ